MPASMGTEPGGTRVDPEFEEKYKKIWAKVEAMSPEDQEKVRAAALEQLLRRRRVEVDGKVTSLRRLIRRVEEQKRMFESGAYDETVRTLPQWLMQELTPGDQIRQGAYKQQLRWREEAELELDRFGQGAVFSSRPVLGKLFGGRQDFAWGIYARPANMEQALSKDWAGQDPQQCVESSNLYLDAIRHCHNVELTLMVLTSRPMPLAATREVMAAKLERSMLTLSGREELKPQQLSDLRNFISKFDDSRVGGAGWVDSKGNVKEGTHFIFSTTPKAELLVEAITPGRLKDRRMNRVCINRNPLVTAAMFGVFLGEEPLDDAGKKDVGYGLLWVANGFRFRPWEMHPNQFIAEEGPDNKITFPTPKVELVDLPLRPNVFQLLNEQAQPLRRMLLGGVRQAKTQAALQVA